MKKIILVCGLISGLLVSALMITTSSLCHANNDYDMGLLLGYTSMILALSLVFVGIKNFRDKYNNGAISFGKAFKVGLYITLIAATIYVLVWLVAYNFFMPDFLDKYGEHMLGKLKASGASLAEIEKQTKEMADMKVMYKNPIFTALFTYVEILPVGLIVTLISALLLKKKKKQ